MAPSRVWEHPEVEVDTDSVSVQPSELKQPPLLHPSLVTTDFDALRFSAASAIQLLNSGTINATLPRSHHLISSPYNSPAHYLDLSELNPPNSLLARALAVLQPTRLDYATADYLESFNWTEVLATLRQLAKQEGYVWKKQEFYAVIFRSRLRGNIDKPLLHALDEQSHAEATVSGGLLKYWFGSVDAERRNLATCMWRNREDAHRGGTGPWHRKARIAARDMYEYIQFSTWRMTIDDGAEHIVLDKWTSDASKPTQDVPFRNYIPE